MDSIIRMGKAAHDISLWVDAEDSRPKRFFHVDGPQAVVIQHKSILLRENDEPPDTSGVKVPH